MRALVQRVVRAQVTVSNWVSDGVSNGVADGVADEVVGAIGVGLCVFIGVTHSDTEAHSKKLANKLWNLRVMNDDDGVMNRSVADTTAEVLIVSQFTLYGDTSAGRRPSWIAAARPEQAEPLISTLIDELRLLGARVSTGRFRTDMAVELVNDGPITVMVEV
jgi:D-aminoacyl-tRNA deacylase